MMQQSESFRDLNVYKKARAIARRFFELSRAFPKEERYSPTDHGCHSSRSIGAPSVNPHSSFTILEVLVSMAIVTVIVLMVSNMFLSTSEAWDIGTRKTELNIAGRAALEFMARELKQAVAGPVKTGGAGALSNLVFRQENPGEIRFIAMSQKPGGINRAVRDVIFYFRPYPTNKITVCMNQYKGASYTNQPVDWGKSGANNLLGNVNHLEFFVYETAPDLENANWVNVDIAGRDFSNQLPFCVDIFLEILSKDDMEIAGQLSGAARTEFISRNAKAFSTRVYFSNRIGYGGDL